MEQSNNKLTSIEFTCENCDYWSVAIENILRLSVEGLTTSLELQPDGRVQKQLSCQTIVISLRYKEINQAFREGDRLAFDRDITHVTLHYESGRELDILVPWNFRSQSVNANMMVSVNQRDNEELILISSDEQRLRNNWWMTEVNRR